MKIFLLFCICGCYHSDLEGFSEYLCAAFSDSTPFSFMQIVVHRSSPRGTHFRRAGPRQKVLSFIKSSPPFLLSSSIISDIETVSQVYFESDEVYACIVTCGGLCPGLNTVIREIVCGLYDMYGVHRVLGIEV